MTSLIQSSVSHKFCAAVAAASLLLGGNVFAPGVVSAALASPPPEQVGAGATMEVERVVVTGSNIPTAEEVGPNPVDTYRTEDIQKLGAHNATDLITKQFFELTNPSITRANSVEKPWKVSSYGVTITTSLVVAFLSIKSF